MGGCGGLTGGEGRNTWRGVIWKITKSGGRKSEDGVSSILETSPDLQVYSRESTCQGSLEAFFSEPITKCMTTSLKNKSCDGRIINLWT